MLGLLSFSWAKRGELEEDLELQTVLGKDRRTF